MEDAEIVAICDRNSSAAKAMASEFAVARTYTSLDEALSSARADFVDIITPPSSHLDLVEMAARHRLPVICQKPLAPNLETAERIVSVAARSGIRLMVHENFRFQPWHRAVKSLLDAGVIGSQLHTISCHTRLGDGWGDEAYLGRQPYFRDMQRFLIQETGVHFIDTFRYLAGEIDEVFCTTKRLNKAIQGEDAVHLLIRFASGAMGTWDANRYNESLCTDPRYTFGTFVLEGNEGSIWVNEEGEITVARLGDTPKRHEFEAPRTGFAGDCVLAAQRHFIDCLQTGNLFETSGNDYLANLRIVESAYDSAARNRPVRIEHHQPSRQIIDLSIPINNRLPGAEITACKTVDQDGWNATTISLYSHCGTHMDAPKHFLTQGTSIDQMPLEPFIGTAKVIDLTPVIPKELLTVERITEATGTINAGDRVLLRTDWHRNLGTSKYRNELPRISPELARWFVEKQVALVGVEPPSVADVNNLDELTEVHRILLEGNIVIVEGLTNLDQLTRDEVEFITLPLRIESGDGCPVRAIAIQSNTQTPLR
ncbi:Kynurenine formamidase [Bremerella volcania]|uniref:Kynurenine formamidase n=2 Tax=Bremerella volcania TaxID=2527984 RepID=A0A518C996_9BACT|nr:Kynurenine formamidase [Bremerella volcania]